MSNVIENRTENPSAPNEIMPTTWTFLKAFWSATWRGSVYSYLFIVPFINSSNPFSTIDISTPSALFVELYIFCISALFLFPAMWQLNRIIYSQNQNFIRLEINNKSILFYLILISIPYFILLFISYSLFGKINLGFEYLVLSIIDLFIFYRMMTKGIMGHRIITRKIA